MDDATKPGWGDVAETAATGAAPGGAAREAPRPRLLMVGLDPADAATLEPALRTLGAVRSVAAQAAGPAAVALGSGDVALIDLRAAVQVGEAVALLRARLAAGVYLVALAGPRQVSAEIAALRAGADDYVPRPVAPPVVAERLRAELRRRGREVAAPALPAHLASRALLPGLSLDLAGHRLVAGAAASRLSAAEFQMLQTLASPPGRVRSRGELAAAAGGRTASDSAEAVASHIKRLRRKIRELLPEVEAIETVYGMGYRLSV